MIVLNFTHPLTEAQTAQATALCGEPIDAVVPVPATFDLARPFSEQVRGLADAAGLDADAWQTGRILVVPPALNFIAVLLLAELHGRMGYFPPCLRLRPVPGALPPVFEVAEILNLQTQRDEARNKRA